MQKKNHCFFARNGADRYRLALLPLYPQLLQLREIIKRLAVMCNGNREVVQINSVENAAKKNDKLSNLLAIERNIELCWTVTFEAAGVLANSFAPYPTENCRDERAKEYLQLWSATDNEFFSVTIPRLKESLKNALTMLQNHAKGTTNVVEGFIDCDHSNSLKNLFRETRALEAIDSHLKRSFIASLQIECDQKTTELMFPFSSSRLLL